MTEFKDEYIILRLANKELMEELLYLRDGIEHEEVDADGNPITYDLMDAFQDASDQVNFSEGASRSYRNNIRDIEIALGRYVVVTEEELSRTISMSGGKSTKNYAFKYKGLKYKFNPRSHTDDTL